MSAEFRPTIMVVDDDPVNLSLLSIWVGDAARSVHVYSLASEALKEFDTVQPDLVISDLHMDGMNGLELAAALKDQDPDFPIIMITAYGDQSSLIDAINIGINHFLLKPLTRSTLLRYVQSLTRILQTKRNLHATQELLVEQKLLLENMVESERKIGAAVQSQLLFHAPPHDMGSVKTGHEIVPAHVVSGDLLDHFTWSPNCIDLIVGDAMGKGLSAAFMGAGLKTSIMTVIAQGIVETHRVIQAHLLKQIRLLQKPDLALPIPRILSKVNTTSFPVLRQLESFVTLIYLRINTHKAKLYWVDCGHSKIILQRAHQKKCLLLCGHNTPMGISLNEEYLVSDVPIFVGDRIFVASDGLTELRDENGDLLGFSGVVDILEKTRDIDMNAAIKKCGEIAAGYAAQKDNLPDDRTLVGLEISEVHTHHPFAHHEFWASLELLPVARNWVLSSVHKLLTESGLVLESGWIDTFLLGASECISNVLRHSVFEPSTKFEISLILQQKVMSLEVLYQGRYFEQNRHNLNLSPVRESAYGLFIIDSVFDQVGYHQDHGGTQAIILAKNLKIAESAN